MRHWLPINIICLLLLSCASGPRIQRVADPSALIERGMVYTGGDGVRVELVELNTGEAALIRVTGTRTQLDGKVLEHRVNENGTRTEHITQVEGRDHYTVVRERPRFGNGEPKWTLYVRYAEFNGLQIRFDEEASKTLDTVALYRTYEEQRDDGTLEALQRFDREREEQKVEESLDETVQRMAKACQTEVQASIDWSTIDDDMIKELSISGYCSHGLDALRQLCKNEPARAFATEHATRYQCRFGDEMSLSVADQAMTWSVNREGVNMSDFARKALLEQAYGGSTLGGEIAVAETKVCVDEKRERYMVFAPQGSEHPGLLYGDGKRFHVVPHPEMMSEGWFFDPRFFNERHNSGFRGLDLRVHSFVEVEDDASECTVRCGTVETKLPVMPASEVPELVQSMEVGETPWPRLPYALARDRRGTYYLVDRSTEPGRERDFRLYVGPMGNLKRQDMKNVVSDSEGEIFSSKAGELRFIVGKEEARWITGRRQRKLLKVPIAENWQMIYNNLGVYFGVNMGTPCDDYGTP